MVSAVILTEDIMNISNRCRFAIKIQPIIFGYEVFCLAYSELQDGITKAGETMISMLPSWAGNPRLMHDAHIIVQHRITSFLSASRLFLDHVETALKRQFGPKSPQVDFFKSQAASLFDGNFSYRFMYKRRNMAQHVSVSIINFRMVSESGSDGQIHKSSFCPAPTR